MGPGYIKTLRRLHRLSPDLPEDWTCADSWATPQGALHNGTSALHSGRPVPASQGSRGLRPTKAQHQGGLLQEAETVPLARGPAPDSTAAGDHWPAHLGRSHATGENPTPQGQTGAPQEAEPRQPSADPASTEAQRSTGGPAPGRSASTGREN
jgi:hypothetical protein